jgi:hypothetical protein
LVVIRSPLDEVDHRRNVVSLVFDGWQADVAEVAENAAHLPRLVIVVYARPSRHLQANGASAVLRGEKSFEVVRR